MFRFVGSDFENLSEEEIYLQQIASQTIIDGLRACYPLESDDDIFWIIISPYFPEDFFSGFAQYVGMKKDTAAGIRFIKEKIRRMIEKMADMEKAYTFDVFEELLFAIAILSAQEEVEYRKAADVSGKKNPYINRKQALAIAGELKERFSYSEKEAKKTAGKVLRFDKMLLDNDEDENLFFWDDDYDFFFQDGLIDGINMLKSYAGEQAGYGYEYTCEIFKDIGLKPPLLLLGTKEANRIANEITAQRVAEEMEKLFKSEGNKYMDLPEGLNDEDFPFN